MTLCALAHDAGADGSANVPRPLCGLLFNLAKPQVHATPSAPASSTVTDREQLQRQRFLSVFEFFIRFRVLAGVLIALIAT